MNPEMHVEILLLERSSPNDSRTTSVIIRSYHHNGLPTVLMDTNIERTCFFLSGVYISSGFAEIHSAGCITAVVFL